MTVTDISTSGRLAEELSESELRESAVRGLAQARSLRTGGVTSAVIGDERNSSASSQIRRLFNQYAPLSYHLPWEMLDYVEILATYNPDYSQAVENIKMLANSGHTLFVDAGSDLQQRKIKDFLEEKARKIQETHGGIDGIIDKLLDQAATFGAMCGEWVLSEDLTEVVDFVDLSPKKIRYFWDEDEQRYLPFQMVTSQQAREAEKNRQEVRGNCVRLNELTFRYYAFDAAPESPYGTPPFIAALANIAIQRDMVHNMAQIVKKLGLLGIIDLTVERLPPLPGETDEQYTMRAGNYLDSYVPAAEDMVREGGLVHFDDVKAETWQLAGNAAGATNIHKANEEMIFSGLKSMPSVQGRSYSTTETYAGVAYDIIIRNTRKYQQAVKRMIESGYWLMATLAGLRPDSIKLSFNENRSLNRVEEANAEKIEIANALMKWLLGIIDQTGVAQELGYSEPKTALEAPPENALANASVSGSETNPEGESEEKVKTRATIEGSDDDEDES